MPNFDLTSWQDARDDAALPFGEAWLARLRSEPQRHALAFEDDGNEGDHLP